MVDFEFEFDELIDIHEAEQEIQEYKPRTSIHLEDLRKMYHKCSLKEAENLFIKSCLEEMIEINQYTYWGHLRQLGYKIINL